MSWWGNSQRGDRCDAPPLPGVSLSSVCFHGPQSSHNSTHLCPRGAIRRREGVSGVPKLIPELLKGGAVGIGGIAGLMRVRENRVWAALQISTRVLGSLIISSSQTLELNLFWRIFALRLHIFHYMFLIYSSFFAQVNAPFIKCGRWARRTIRCETKSNNV